jgi:hypothetical protein
MQEYKREEALRWLHKVDQYVREYSDKIAKYQDDEEIMFRYYGMKLERACKELEIPWVTLSESI